MEWQGWVGRDATERGQMVDEKQMGKDGIFDRLARDLRFRAVATRLLQRYGYLTPEVNPNSEQGKRQQMRLMAEQKRLEEAPVRQSSAPYPQGPAQVYPSEGLRPVAPPGTPSAPQAPQAPAPQQWGPVPTAPRNQPGLSDSRGQLVNLRETNQSMDSQGFSNSEVFAGGSLQPGALRSAIPGGLDGASGYGQGR